MCTHARTHIDSQPQKVATSRLHRPWQQGRGGGALVVKASGGAIPPSWMDGSSKFRLLLVGDLESTERCVRGVENQEKSTFSTTLDHRKDLYRHSASAGPLQRQTRPNRHSSLFARACSLECTHGFHVSCGRGEEGTGPFSDSVCTRDGNDEHFYWFYWSTSVATSAPPALLLALMCSNGHVSR